MMETPKVSIIIPVYNVEAYLEKCLDSAIFQTLQDIEMIVVNDESTDNSLHIIHTYAEKDPRIVVIDQKNRGLGGARNSGIEVAKGEYLFFLDSDDYIAPDTLETLYHHAQEHQLDLIVFNYTKVDEKGTPLTTTNFGNAILSKEEAFRKIVSLKTSPQAWNKLYRRDLFIDHNIRYPEKFLHEDLPVTYRLFWYTDQIGYIENSFYFWLTRTGSITQKFTFDHINDITTSLLQMKQFLQEHQVFETYKTEYIRGSMQMLNILMERAIRFSHHTSALVVYVHYIIDSGKIIHQDDIALMESYDIALYKKFKKHYHIVSKAIQKNRPVENCKTKLINYLLPMQSQRRAFVKKILRRK